MGKGAQGKFADHADVAKKNGVRKAAVHFPLAGNGGEDLGTVRVIDWGREGPSNRMTLTGPVAHKIGVDDAIEATVRTERLCGGGQPGPMRGPLMVELAPDSLNQISGASYTLALAIADKIARGCLPRLDDCTVIASGKVRSDGKIDAVGRIKEKLHVIKQALEAGALVTPILVLPRANLEALALEEQQLLNELVAAGVRCEGVAALEEMNAAWPSQQSSGREQMAHVLPTFRKGWIILLVIASVLGLSVSLLFYQMNRVTDACRQLSSHPEIVARCWEVLPLQLDAEYRVEYQGGYRPWRAGESGTCLTVSDQFRLVLQPAADGWLYVFHLDTTDWVLDHLWPERAPRRVRSGETIRLPSTGRSYHIDGRAKSENFFALLTRQPLPAGTVKGSPSTELAEFLERWAERFVLCHAPTAYSY